MSRHLFLFAITPVQSFVEQARKTQDLDAGSFLLSHLCKIAGSKMVKDFKGEIIFPNLDNQSIPNRFLAVIETDEESKLETGKALQGAVEDEFSRIADSVINSFKISDKPNGFDEQIKSYFTVNWLFLPFNGEDYNQRYEDIESLMGAIKTVRLFNQFPDSEKGRKCSICGERNVKFYRLTEREKNISAVKSKKLFSDDVHIVKIKDYEPIAIKHLQAGEGLCAVCFTKRCLEKSGLYGYTARFPSISKITLFEAFKTLKEKDKGLIWTINSDDYEPHGIFALKHSKSLDEMPDTDRKNTETLYKALKDNNISYSPYYAVMLFDGDSMGQWLSGSKIKDRMLKRFHETLTEKLGGFAEEVRKSVKEPIGVTVYAGGEDFLGFFNLNCLFHSMKLLREKFDEIVNKPLKDADFYKNKSDDMTFSAGVVLAHFKTPLSEVLNWARKVEHEAKDIDGNKDAFAIAVLKHSGEIDKAVFKWKCEGIFVTDTIADIANQINTDMLSNTFIKRINQEMLKLIDKDGKYPDDQIIDAELKRLLTRSCMRLKNESKEEFEQRKKETVARLGRQLHNILVNSKSVGNFLSILNITDFIARQVKGETQQ